jgi:hypothetical protein
MTLIVILVLIVTGILFVGYTYFYESAWFNVVETVICWLVGIGWLFILMAWAIEGRVGL